MRSILRAGLMLSAAVAAVGCSDDPAAPKPTLLFVTNGDFETGDLTNWTDSVVSNSTAGVYVGNATTGPASGKTVPVPPEGTNGALFDQNGPATHILYQDITIPADYSAAFEAMIYLNNEWTDYTIAATEGLSVFGAENNQQFRIDVMDPAAPVDGVGAGVLLNIYQTMPGDALTASIPVTADLSAFAGMTVRLRFAAAVKMNYFQVGIDAVQVTGT